MTFRNRYFLRLIAPPALVTLPLAFVFLTQVEQLTGGSAIGVAVMLLVLGAAVAAGMFVVLGKRVDDVDNAAALRGDVSRVMSETLARSTMYAAIFHGGGALLFALVGMLTIDRSGFGFVSCLAAALIVAFPSTLWSYAEGKRVLVNGVQSAERIRFTGRRVPLGRKIAVVFIGGFGVSALITVLLVVARPDSALTYALVVSALTMLFFAGSTWFVARDIAA
ncbi:MAG TPA: hypothetical protein VJ032_07135, partial [Thermoanaerobaculia bacterium]|nr:hypothetical protein [Thermoanaerobaculia bacterium]